jgi:hypothetical protein
MLVTRFAFQACTFNHFVAAAALVGTQRFNRPAPAHGQIRAEDPRPRRLLSVRVARGKAASTSAQSDVRQSLAAIVVGEKNRCVVVGALDGSIVVVQRWFLRAGRDNFGDNLRAAGVPVTQRLSYT